MTKCPLCNIDLDLDDIRLIYHISNIQARVEIAKALANIFVRLKVIERNIEKSHGSFD
jgi:hypothetical protein